MIDWDALVIGPAVAVFGELVLYQPKAPRWPGGPLVSSGLQLPVIGVFDAEYLELSPLAIGEMIGMPSNIGSTRPVLGVQMSQFPVPPAQGDLLLVAATGQAFVVAEVRADGHGHAKLLLNEAP